VDEVLFFYLHSLHQGRHRLFAFRFRHIRPRIRELLPDCLHLLRRSRYAARFGVPYCLEWERNDTRRDARRNRHETLPFRD